MSWEQRLLDLFEDLEQQAEGAALAARDAEVAELARSEYSEIDLGSRLHASVGCEVELTLRDGLVVRGRMSRAGEGWCLLSETHAHGVGHEWLVAVPTVVAVRGLSSQAQPPLVRPVTSRLGLGSVLRGLAEDRGDVTLFRLDGQRRQGRLGRVGKDFVELLTAEGGPEVVPFSGMSAVRR